MILKNKCFLNLVAHRVELSILESRGKLLATSVDLNMLHVLLTLEDAMKVLVGRHYKVTLFISFLMISLVLTNSFSHPSFCANSDEVKKQFARSLLERVVGVNMSEYSVLTFSVGTHKPSGSVHLVSTVTVKLNKSDEIISSSTCFSDDKFWYCDVRYPEEWLVGNKTITEISAIASKTIEEFCSLPNATEYVGLEDMITPALQNQNLTFENDNMTLKITYIVNSTAWTSIPTSYIKFEWLKKPQIQLLGGFFLYHGAWVTVSQSGLVTQIYDNNRVYIGSTEVNISEDEAINISTPYAEAHCTSYGLEVVSINASFEWRMDYGCKRGDDFAVYPTWRVFFYTNKLTPTQDYGYLVMLWADTGEVFGSGAYGVAIPEDETNSIAAWLLVAMLPATVALTGLATYLKRRNKRGKSNE